MSCRRGNEGNDSRIGSCDSGFDDFYGDDSYALGDDFDNEIFSSDYRNSSNRGCDDRCESDSDGDLARCERALARARAERARLERELQREKCETEKLERELARVRAQLQRIERELERVRCELQRVERELERERCARERCNRELERCESREDRSGSSCGC